MLESVPQRLQPLFFLEIVVYLTGDIHLVESVDTWYTDYEYEIQNVRETANVGLLWIDGWGDSVRSRDLGKNSELD